LVTPLKPLEAMARGQIVLASDVGGHRELIRDGETGFFFPADNVAALTSAVLNVLSRRAEWPRIRAAGRRFVEEERAWKASVARYRGTYAQALSSQRDAKAA
jgi:glycosyltransferase involved in cell wall biosynthesis